MNIISYNLKRHIELLKYEKKVRSQNKSFFKENQTEFLEQLLINTFFGKIALSKLFLTKKLMEKNFMIAVIT